MKIDLAEKRDELTAVPQDSEKGRGPHYPTVCIYNHADLSGLKIDQEVTLKGRVKGVRKDERDDGTIKYGADIEVMSADVSEAKGAKSLSKTASAADDEAEVEKGLKGIEEMGGGKGKTSKE